MIFNQVRQYVNGTLMHMVLNTEGLVGNFSQFARQAIQSMALCVWKLPRSDIIFTS